jgi:hypothetical protein
VAYPEFKKCIIEGFVALNLPEVDPRTALVSIETEAKRLRSCCRILRPAPGMEEAEPSAG